MIIVGLTGGIASGKSEAAKIFRSLGARVIDADTISRALLRPRTESWHKVIAAFGKEIVNEDLTVDREKLGDIIFADREKRRHLNSLLHPAIVHRIEATVKRIKEEEPGALVVIDAALLVETGFSRRCDKVIVISAAEEVQLQRLHERDGIPRQKAQQRIDAQLPLADKVAVADYLINNDGSLESLQAQTERVFQALSTLASAGGVVKKR